MKKILILFVLLLLVGGFGVTYWQRGTRPAATFRTVPVKRGDLLITIGATGTVEPEDVVDVGAQVAGKIESFGKDPDGSGKTIDYGSVVDEGTVLAQIDDALYAADVEQAVAQVEQAKASVIRAQADLEQMRAKLRQAEQNWTRAKDLGPSRALSATDYDSFEAAYETGKATMGVGQATILQAQKAVAQAEAFLKRATTNLGYCTIRSPVKGVIVDRRVNIGQTVVASLNAPSLFLIAQDLKKMEVWASVNEADIGSIHAGQGVTFTVDAFPGETFRGEVGKTRLNASMTQNVVTYTVEVHTDNSSGKLLPYLTANVQFEVTRHKDVLMVPNAALRWTPDERRLAPDAPSEYVTLVRRRSASMRSAASGEPRGTTTNERRTVWIQDGTFVRPVTVEPGVSDVAMTEIRVNSLKEGDEVIVGESEQNDGNDTTNPFTPQFFGNRRPG